MKTPSWTPSSITPHRLRFLARRLITNTANAGDISETATVLEWAAQMIEEEE